MKKQSFYSVLTDAVNEFRAKGFTSAANLEMWVEKIRQAAKDSLTPEEVLEKALLDTFGGIYRKLVERGQILRLHPGVSRYTLARVKPRLRAELDRRMMVSRNLIRLNREQMIEETVQRFSGWASSVPAGGSRAAGMKDTKDDIRKSLASLPFRERRVHIDQGMKFTSALNDIVAVDGGAIAARWHSQWRRPGYQFRPDHKERDGKVYAIRGNWAFEKGLMQVGPNGYTDQITGAGEEIFCSCYYEYIYSLDDLPEDMITAKGRESMEKVRDYGK